MFTRFLNETTHTYTAVSMNEAGVGVLADYVQSSSDRGGFGAALPFKQQLWAKIEKAPQALLLSSRSSLTASQQAMLMQHPGRPVGAGAGGI